MKIKDQIYYFVLNGRKETNPEFKKWLETYKKHLRKNRRKE